MRIAPKQHRHSDTEKLLQSHRLHLGVYQRVAHDLHVDPSFVSRVANGQRESKEVMRELVRELGRIHALTASAKH
jgi:hypothetical protein